MILGAFCVASVCAGTASKENVCQYRMVTSVSVLFRTDYSNNILSFNETISLVKHLSGYGSHLMHISIYTLLKAQLTKDDCIELFDSNTLTISDYITAVDISQSTFDRSRKSHE